MKYLLLLTLLLPILLYAQPWQQETSTIPVEINGWRPFSPWTGGFQFTSPELVDIDGDGDNDFFVGHTLVAYFRNDGSAQTPSFIYVTDNYEPFWPIGPQTGSSLEFADIDNDGDFDAFVSGLSAYTSYYENIGTSQTPEFELVIDTLRDVDGNSIRGEHVCLIDLDSDDDYDLFVDRYFGIITRYENTGTQDSSAFQMAEYQFEGISAGSMPKSYFADLDADGDFDLLVGNEQGSIWYYQNVGDSANWDFQLITTQFDSIDAYLWAKPAASEIDADGDLDLFVGFYADNPLAPRGDVFFWQNQGTPYNYDYEYITSEYLTLDEGWFAQGEFVDINADGLVDMLLACGPDISFFENVGTATQPSFLLQTEQFAGLNFPIGNDPVFYDLDGDGDLDLANGEGFYTYSRIRFYRNTGSMQLPSYEYWFEVYQPGAFAENPDITDIDNDGDGDLFFGDSNGDLYFFENVGSAQHPSFTSITQNFEGIDYPGYIQPTFHDLDQDGDFDLFLGGVGAVGYDYFENAGSPSNPQLILNAPNYFDSLAWGAKVSFADIDADGDADCFFTGLVGGVRFLRNLAISAVPPLPRTAPYRGPVLEVGPNPANPVTTFSFELRVASSVNLEVYDVSGRKVAELLSGRQEAGAHVVTWDASGLGSGVYLARLQVGGESQAGKVVVVK